MIIDLSKQTLSYKTFASPNGKVYVIQMEVKSKNNYVNYFELAKLYESNEKPAFMVKALEKDPNKKFDRFFLMTSVDHAEEDKVNWINVLEELIAMHTPPNTPVI